MTIEIVKAPDHPKEGPDIAIFLAGSIEMGTAEMWQERVENRLVEEFRDDARGHIVVYNPRRDDWDSSWEQSIDNPQFKEQVVWEQDMLEDADIKFFYFSPGTQSPITLMELGMFVYESPIVCCPDGFWRKGNIDVVMDMFAHDVHTDLDEAVEEVVNVCNDLLM